MPPRYAYWTILVDGQPTAFRAAEPDELLPTLKRLQVKQPGALMKWFQRGRLWESKDEAKDKLDQGYTVGPDGALVPPDATAGRGKGWRPGRRAQGPARKIPTGQEGQVAEIQADGAGQAWARARSPAKAATRRWTTRRSRPGSRIRRSTTQRSAAASSRT